MNDAILLRRAFPYRLPPRIGVARYMGGAFGDEDEDFDSIVDDEIRRQFDRPPPLVTHQGLAQEYANIYGLQRRYAPYASHGQYKRLAYKPTIGAPNRRGEYTQAQKDRYKDAKEEYNDLLELLSGKRKDAKEKEKEKREKDKERKRTKGKKGRSKSKHQRKHKRRPHK